MTVKFKINAKLSLEVSYLRAEKARIMLASLVSREVTIWQVL